MQYHRWQFGALCALMLVWPKAAPAAWSIYGNGPEHRGQAAEELSPPLAVYWKFASRPYQDTAMGTATPIVNSGSPITTDDTIYLASKDRVYSLDKESGAEKWHWPTGNEQAPTVRSTPALGEGMLYVGAMDGFLYALDANSGSQLWSVKTGASIRSHPLVYQESAGDPGTVYFGSDDDYFYAVDARSGEVKWKYRATDDVASAPCYVDGLLIFNSADAQVHALTASTGKPRWMQRTPVPTIGMSTVIYGSRVFLASGNNLYAFRMKGGVPQVITLYDPKTRQSALEGDITTTPIITEDPNGSGSPSSGLVYVADRSGYFYSFYLNGRLRWKTKLDDRSFTMPVLAGKTIYVGSNKGFIYGIDTATGQITWRYRAEAPRDYQIRYASFNLSGPLVVDAGKLLVLGDDGTLNAFAADAIDVTPPVVTGPEPKRGLVLNGSPPLTLSTYLWDEGSGINPATVAVYLDGQLLEASVDPYDKKGGTLKEGVVYNPVKRHVAYNTAPMIAGQKATPLANGHHNVKVEAADWRGNVGSMEWTFIVDNTLPPRPRRQPQQPGTTGTPGGPGGYGTPGMTPGGTSGVGGYPGGRPTRTPQDPRRRRR